MQSVFLLLFQEILWINGVLTRHRGKSKQSEGNNQGQITKNNEEGSKPNRKGRNSKQICL